MVLKYKLAYMIIYRSILLYFVVEAGIELQTSNNDVSNYHAGGLRDGSGTCIEIPKNDTEQKYIKFRLSWPIVSNGIPNFAVKLKGHDIPCYGDTTYVYMKVRH